MLLAWLAHRGRRWPSTANPHLIINQQTAMTTRAVSENWLAGSCRGLTATLERLRVDRQLEEALTCGADPPPGFPLRSDGRPRGHLLSNLCPLRGPSDAALDGAPFRCTGLSGDLCRARDGIGVDPGVAGRADDQGLAPHAGHEGWPGPGLPRRASLVTWWTATAAPCPHSSHPPLAEPVDQLLIRGEGGDLGDLLAG